VRERGPRPGGTQRASAAHRYQVCPQSWPAAARADTNWSSPAAPRQPKKVGAGHGKRNLRADLVEFIRHHYHQKCDATVGNSRSEFENIWFGVHEKTGFEKTNISPAREHRFLYRSRRIFLRGQKLHAF